MTLENPVIGNNIVRGEDLQYVINAINDNEIFGDQVTLSVDKRTGGTTITIVQQEQAESAGVVSGAQVVYPAIINSGGSGGVYSADIYDLTGENLIEAGATVIASPATATALPAGFSTLAYKVPANTLGSG